MDKPNKRAPSNKDNVGERRPADVSGQCSRTLTQLCRTPTDTDGFPTWRRCLLETAMNSVYQYLVVNSTSILSDESNTVMLLIADDFHSQNAFH